MLGSANPVYSETFSFQAEPAELGTVSLSLAMLQSAHGQSGHPHTQWGAVGKQGC